MNILISAIGSMASEAVISSLRKIEGARLIGCDIYEREWIYPSTLVDVFYQVPLAVSHGYVDEMLAICLREDVRYVLPLTDPEVDVLSTSRRVFEENGITLCISSERVIHICRNKKLFFEYLSGVDGLKLVPTYTFDTLPNGLKGPLIAKPKTGRSSERVKIIKERNEIPFQIRETDKYIFQPFLNGTVVTADIVRDSHGNFFFISREELLRTKNGAGTTVRLFNDNRLAKAISIIVSRLRFWGCVNVEFLYDGEAYYLMDINPRFSAGIAFSQKAGYDFVCNHLKVFVGDRIAPGVSYDTKVMSKRYVEFV